MPGGSSGGGWFAEGKATPVPHTSTAPVTAGRPRARRGRPGIFTMMSEKFAGR